MRALAADTNVARLWRPDPDSDVSLFKASFTTFAFERHTHDEFAIGVIERGAQRFHHKGSVHLAPPRSIVTVNPDEVHDGMPGSEEGYHYRMLYVGLPYLEDSFGELFPGKGLRAFASPVTFDPDISGRLAAALGVLDHSPHLLDQLLLPVLHDLFAHHASPRVPGISLDGHEGRICRAIAFMRDRIHRNPDLDTLARQAGMSKYHFLRVFKRQTGLTPHAYLLRLRTREAKRALEQGHTPSEAAAMAGFADQSHLTRRFKAMFGVTPGSFRNGIRMTLPATHPI